MRLRCINPMLRPNARKALKAGDVAGFFCTVDSMNYMVLLADNADEFRKRGLYERALLCAWSGQKVTVQRVGNHFFSWGRQVGNALLRCDRDKLRAASDPLPEGDTFTIYRGVWEAAHEVRGIAWTLSLKVAQHFAHGFGGACGEVGEVYTTQVKRADVLAYINESGRGEQEVLVVLPDSHAITKLQAVTA